MNSIATFSFMGMQCGLLSDNGNEQSLKASLECVKHFAENIKNEYPAADISHVMLLTSIRLSELLCSVQKKDDDDLKVKIQDYENFVNKIIDLLAAKS